MGQSFRGGPVRVAGAVESVREIEGWGAVLGTLWAPHRETAMMPAVGMPVRTVTEPELDRETLERCRGGDPRALHAFVQRYERAVFALLSRIERARRCRGRSRNSEDEDERSR
jgi:hypothetical protein